MLQLFTMCIKLPMSMGYKKFEIPINVTEVELVVSFLGGGAISNVSFIFSSKNSTLVRQRPLDPCSGVHLQ